MTAAATDSERDVRPTYEEVMDAYRAHRRAGQEMHAALLDIWRMADPDGRKHLTFQDPSDVLASTLALLTEQAATIERVRGLIPLIDAGYTISRQDLTRALGSQRTEGHRG